MKNFSYELTPIPPKEKITVFAEHTDMLILMIYIWNRKIAEIFMTSRTKKNKKKKLVNVQNLMADLSPLVVKNVLSIHAWNGCDTTSGILNQGKTTVMNMTDNKNSKVLADCEVFN